MVNFALVVDASKGRSIAGLGLPSCRLEVAMQHIHLAALDCQHRRDDLDHRN